MEQVVGVEVRARTDQRARFARFVMAEALLLGALADAVLRDTPWGIGWTMWVAALLLTVCLLAIRRGVPLSREQLAWCAVALACSVFYAWRDADMLQLGNWLGTVFALAMCSMSLSRTPRASILAARVRDVLAACKHSMKDALAGAVPLWSREAVMGAALHQSAAKRVAALRAAVITLPLLLVFGKLLSQADPIFGRLFELPDLNLGTVVSHGILIGGAAWACAGWMRGALIDGSWRTIPADGAPFKLARMDITAALGGLNALFALFVGMQLRWLFGGADVVRATTGLSVAEYARHGFFELVTVSALVAPVILVSGAAVEGDASAVQRHRRLSLALLAFLGAIMLSAVFRMRLYVTYYGLSVDRLYALVFMGGLAIVFLCMALTVLRGWSKPFAAMSVISGFATLFAMNVANPELIVTRSQLRHPPAGRAPDFAYLRTLSGDAAPALARVLASSEPSRTTCDAATWMAGRWQLTQLTTQKLTQWNAAEDRAIEVVLKELTPHSLRRLCASSATSPFVSSSP